MNGVLKSVYLSILISAFLLPFLSSLSLGQQNSVPDEPTLTVRITPPKPYLQEQIVQVIRLIAPHPFEELVLDLPSVEGAETITLQQPKNRKFQTYGGEGYIYETSRAIFPKQSGELRIPPVRISGSVGVSRDEREPFALRSDATILDVRPPPESFSEPWWLVAREVKIDEGWSQPLDTLRVGDRVTRSIEVTVAGATGAHLPELDQGRSTGLTVLPGRTERRTEITPGGVVGTISRSFDIRIDVAQPINISPVRVVWWNTNTEIERRSAAAAVRLEPLPPDVEKLVSDAMANATEARANSRHGIAAITFGLATVMVAFALWLVRSRRKVKPEDLVLRQALSRSSTPLDTASALRNWAEATFPSERPMTLEQLGLKLGPKAQQRIKHIQQAAFGQTAAPIDSAGLALDIMTTAQEYRRQRLSVIVASLVDRLLGPNRRLPDIAQRPTQKAR